MKSCTLFLLLALISCGKNVTKTRFIENKFNDSNIHNQLIAHEARIKALEDAQQGFLVRGDIKDFLTSDQIDTKLKIIETLATKSELMEIKSICDSREQLLKSGNELFAVISTINKVTLTFKDCKKAGSSNQETCVDRTQEFEKTHNVHLGKLSNGEYMLTDGSNVTFEVVNGKVTNCRNN